MSMAPTTAFFRSEKSTNVRAKTRSEAAKWLFGRFAEVAPPAAAWVAERLFVTPPRIAPPAAEREALTRARRFHIPFLDGQIAAWFWVGEGPSVLLVHGWGGRAGQLAPIAEHLVSRGFSVVAFDAPAHGESTGKTTNLLEFADAIGAVLAAYGPVIGTVAHSMGGAAAAIALGRKLPLGRTVVIGSPSSLIQSTHRFAGMVGLTEAVRSRMQRRIERRVGLPFSALELEAQPRPDAPVLVVHDQRDGEVPYEEGRRISEAWGTELFTTDGLGHRRILKDVAVLEKISAFVGQDLARTFVPKSCATDGCPRVAASGSDVWTGWEGYCATCALELDLRHRPPQRRG